MNKHKEISAVNLIKQSCNENPDGNITNFLKSGYVKNFHFSNEYRIMIEQNPNDELSADCLFCLLCMKERERERCIRKAFKQMKIKRTSKFKRNMYDIFSYLAYKIGFLELSEKFSKDICGKLMFNEILKRCNIPKRND